MGNFYEEDKKYYTKEYAVKSIPTRAGFLLFKLKMFELYYFSYGCWLPHSNWWHPFTWVYYVFLVCYHGFKEIGYINDQMFLPKEERKYSYKDAPKTDKKITPLYNEHKKGSVKSPAPPKIIQKNYRNGKE